MAAARCRDCGGNAWSDDGRCKACNSFPTLGFQIADFIEAKCVIPDRDQVGEPFVLTNEQLRFLLYLYRLRPNAKFDPRTKRWQLPFFFNRGGQLVRPQKWGKGPFGSAIICGEAEGPAVFDGWDADGQPVGRPWMTPLIQVTALAEDQTQNVWSALLPMIELGDFSADIPDTGLTRINLRGGGRIEPVTSAAKTRLGQRVTFILQDQTESWLQSNGGRALADNQRRNIAGMGGRWLSTPNAWDPTEESVAQYTSEHEHDGVYHDDVTPPEGLSIRNKRERRKALKFVYGDSYWVDLDRIDAEIEALLPRDPAQAERWFLNRKEAEGAKAFDGTKWDRLANLGYVVEEGHRITVGVDGARFEDALGMVATEVTTGFQWPLGIWERPDGAPEDYEHPMDEVDAALADAFQRWDVWRVYVDPGSSLGNITPLMERWQGQHGIKKVLPWLMNRLRATAVAVASYADAIGTADPDIPGSLSHDGDKTFARHVKNAVRRPTKMRDEDGVPLYVISKDRPGSPRKIDAAAAAVLSWEARNDCVAAGEQEAPVYRRRGYR